MIDLILTILCASSIGVILKIAESRTSERLTVLLANYIIAAAVSACVWIRFGEPFRLSAFSSILAPCAGFIFALNFFLYILAIKKRGMALPGILMRLAAIVPVIASLIFFGESPGWVQTLGMFVAFVAAVMISLGIRGGELSKGFRGTSPVLLAITSIGLLFCFGLADLSMKLFEQFGHQQEKPLFLALMFGFAGVYVAVSMVIQKVRIKWIDLAWGAGLGLPNLGSSYFLVSALHDLPAYIVFPSVAAVSVMLIAVTARYAFGERLGLLGIVGIVLTIISVVSINI